MPDKQHGPDARTPKSHGVMGGMRSIAGLVLIALVVAFIAWYIVGRAHSLPPAP